MTVQVSYDDEALEDDSDSGITTSMPLNRHLRPTRVLRGHAAVPNPGQYPQYGPPLNDIYQGRLFPVPAPSRSFQWQYDVPYVTQGHPATRPSDQAHYDERFFVGMPKTASDGMFAPEMSYQFRMHNGPQPNPTTTSITGVHIPFKEGEAGTTPVSFRTIEEANAWLRKQEKDAPGGPWRPDKGPSAYDKTDFIIYLSDGTQYQGRIDLGSEPPDLIAHIRAYQDAIPSIRERYAGYGMSTKSVDEMEVMGRKVLAAASSGVMNPFNNPITHSEVHRMRQHINEAQSAVRDQNMNGAINALTASLNSISDVSPFPVRRALDLVQSALGAVHRMDWDQAQRDLSNAYVNVDDIRLYAPVVVGNNPRWRYDQPDYKYYVVRDGKILWGSEYKEDAKEFVTDEGLGKVKIWTRKYAVQQGLEPKNNDNWGRLNPRKRKMTKAAQKYISKKISYLIDKEGYPQDQAVAIAYNMARERGFKVPAAPNPENGSMNYNLRPSGYNYEGQGLEDWREHGGFNPMANPGLGWDQMAPQQRFQLASAAGYKKPESIASKPWVAQSATARQKITGVIRKNNPTAEHILRERGQGFPDVGELIADRDSVYRVIKLGPAAHTSPTDYGGQRRYATLEYIGDPWSVSEDEWESMRSIRIEKQNPVMYPTAPGAGMYSASHAVVGSKEDPAVLDRRNQYMKGNAFRTGEQFATYQSGGGGFVAFTEIEDPRGYTNNPNGMAGQLWNMVPPQTRTNIAGAAGYKTASSFAAKPWHTLGSAQQTKMMKGMSSMGLIGGAPAANPEALNPKDVGHHWNSRSGGDRISMLIEAGYKSMKTLRDYGARSWQTLPEAARKRVRGKMPYRHPRDKKKTKPSKRRRNNPMISWNQLGSAQRSAIAKAVGYKAPQNYAGKNWAKLTPTARKKIGAHLKANPSGSARRGGPKATGKPAAKTNAKGRKRKNPSCPDCNGPTRRLAKKYPNPKTGRPRVTYHCKACDAHFQNS